MTEKETERGNSVLALKAGFWYVAGNFVGKTITFITTPIFARLMTASDYGEFSNFASWAAMLIFITSAELHNTLSRAYYDFKQNYDEYISSVTILGGIITVIVYSSFLFCRRFIFKIVAIPEQYVHLLFIFLFFSFCSLVYYARERTLYRYKSVAVITFLSLFIPTLISICLVFFLPKANHLSARLYGYYLPSALIGLFCTVSLLKKSSTFNWKYCRYGLALSLPLLVHYLTAYLLTSTNVVITKNMLGSEITAVVSIANSATHILTIFFQATSGALTTWLMDNLEMRRNDIIKRGTLFYLFLLALIVIVTILLTPEIILVLGGKKYVASVSILPGLVFATFIQSVTTLFAIILTYDKNIVKTAVYTGMFALFSIVAKITFLPEYGFMVLVYVNIIIFSILLLINYLLIKNAGYAEVINLKGMIFILLFTGIVTAFSQSFYRFSLLRYGFIILLLVCFISLIVRNKKRLLTSVNRFRVKRNA